MLKVKFVHNGKEYYIYCSSVEYSVNTGYTWFYVEKDVLYTREPITITWIFISELDTQEFMGDTDFTYIIK